jgi:hypothetical protein
MIFGAYLALAVCWLFRRITLNAPLSSLSMGEFWEVVRAKTLDLKMAAILVQTRYSLANRLMAVIAGIRLAQATGRELIIGWEPNDFARCRFDDLFDHDFQVVESEDVALKGSIFIPDDTSLNLQIINQEALGDRDITIAAHHFFYLNSDSETKTIEQMGMMLREAFSCLRPLPVITDAVDRLTPELVCGVGLHIRRNGPIELGFDGRAGDPTMMSTWSTPSDRGYINLAKDLIAKFELTGKIFLATTCPETRQTIKSAFEEGRVVIYEGRSYDLHADVEAVQDALIDILCLSKTAIVTKRHPSTFSFLASLLGNTAQAIIYDGGKVEIKTALSY